MLPNLGSTTFILVTLAGLTLAAPVVDPYASCAAKSGALCFGYPENCVASGNCQILFKSSWASGLHFDLIGSGIGADEYIAVGFSNLTRMSGLVVGCYHTAASSEVHFSVNAYVKHHNTDITPQRDVLGFGKMTSSVSGSQLTCSLQLASGSKVKYGELEFDFEQKSYYVQLAKGPLKNGKLGFHGKDFIVSPTPLNLKVSGTLQAQLSSYAFLVAFIAKFGFL